MKKRKLGKSGIEITPIVMGTWQTGKKMWVGIEDKDSIKALQAAVDAGITTFDTAAVYGDGHSERILGKALKDVRGKVVIATKVFANKLKPDQVKAECEKSLRNLNTDFIDLYQIHWPAGSFGSKKVPVEETMGALNELKTQGKIRSVGVSNFSRSQLEEVVGCGRIDSLQPPYSLFWRQVEKELQPYCVENGITILAYSPLAQGILTGKFAADHKFRKGDHRSGHRLFQPENAGRVQEALDKLRPVAEKNKITLGQLALSWLVSRPNTCAVVGARNAEQVLRNAEAERISLSAETAEEIDKIGRVVTDELDDNPVQWE